MKFTPISQILGFLGVIVDAPAPIIWCLLVGVVIPPDAFRPKMTPTQVNQFPSNMHRCQIEKMPY